MSLKIEGVEFKYPSAPEPILRGCSFTVPSGGVTTLLGKNGSGKSTMLRLLLGLLIPDKGAITLDGKPVGSINRGEFSRLVAYVPQDEQPRLPYRVEEYLLMARAPHLGLLEQPSSTDEAQVLRILEERGLSHLRGRLVQELSGGERQMMLVCRALLQEPRVMVLDEPGSHLDLGRRVELMKLLRNIAAEGRTVLYTTQDPMEALLVSGHIALLNKGITVGEGMPEAVLTEEMLREIYGVGVKLVRINGRLLMDLSTELSK